MRQTIHNLSHNNVCVRIFVLSVLFIYIFFRLLFSSVGFASSPENNTFLVQVSLHIRFISCFSLLLLLYFYLFLAARLWLVHFFLNDHIGFKFFFICLFLGHTICDNIVNMYRRPISFNQYDKLSHNNKKKNERKT